MILQICTATMGVYRNLGVGLVQPLWCLQKSVSKISTATMGVYMNLGVGFVKPLCGSIGIW